MNEIVFWALVIGVICLLGFLAGIITAWIKSIPRPEYRDSGSDFTGGRTRSTASYSENGGLKPYSGHTSEGYPKYGGPETSEGHSTPVDYVNSEGFGSRSSDDDD